jgi:hypothetical protein
MACTAVMLGDMTVQRRHVNSGATKTPRSSIGRLGRQAELCVPHSVFPSVPISSVAVRLKISFLSFRKEHRPRALEVGAGFLESWRGPVAMFAGMTAEIEATTPFPRVGIGRVANTYRNRACVHVAVVDMPAVRGLVITATGEFRQSLLHVSALRRQLMKRGARSPACRLALLADEAAGEVVNARCRRSPQGAEVNVAFGLAPGALDFQPGKAAMMACSMVGDGSIGPAVAPHFLVPALAGQVVRFADQGLPDTPLLLGLLGEDLRHRARLHQLLLQRLAVAAR